MIRARKMTPIVFWASWRPWPRAIAEAETVCASRNPRVTRWALRRRKIHMIASITRKASAKPTSGESTIGISTLSMTVLQWTVVPAARAAPTRPPMREWEDDEGKPKYQVRRFHAIAPKSAARMTIRPSRPLGGDDHLGDGLGDLLAQEGADEVHHRGQDQRHARGEGTRRHRRGDRVGRVVEAVGVVEGQRHDHDRDDDREVHCRPAQDSLTVICSMMLATFSKASMAPSSEVTMSLSLSTSIALKSPLKSFARVRR